MSPIALLVQANSASAAANGKGTKTCPCDESGTEWSGTTVCSNYTYMSWLSSFFR